MCITAISDTICCLIVVSEAVLVVHAIISSEGIHVGAVVGGVVVLTRSLVVMSQTVMRGTVIADVVGLVHRHIVIVIAVADDMICVTSVTETIVSILIAVGVTAVVVVVIVNALVAAEETHRRRLVEESA